MSIHTIPQDFSHAALKRYSHGSILALDMGARKVGVAKGSIKTGIAVPLTVLHYANNTHLHTQLTQLITLHEACGIVVGLPSESVREQFANFFTNLDLDVPIIFEDESYTTQMANNMLQEIGVKRKRRNAIDDKISAQLILQNFFAKL